MKSSEEMLWALRYPIKLSRLLLLHPSARIWIESRASSFSCKNKKSIILIKCSVRYPTAT